MAEFIHPFTGMVPGRKLSQRELTRSVRMAMAAELEAVHFYEAIADAADDELAKEVMQDIANEERVHAGEFQRLLTILLPDEQDFLTEGTQEVNDLAEKVAQKTDAEKTESEIPTVGNMKS